MNTNPGLLGKKLGMTQYFDDDGNIVPCTVIEAGPCTVTQIKTVETDGYNAIQIGFYSQKENRVTKAMKGHYAKGGIAPAKLLREFRLDDVSGYTMGQVLSLGDVLEVGQKVDVTGTSKGNPPALKRLLDGGVVMRPFSDEIMAGARDAAQAYLEDNASKDPGYRKVYEAFSAARTEQRTWFGTAERAYHQFVTS